MANEATTRRWLLADEPVPVRLMATIWADAEGLHDDLAAPPRLDAWLDAIGVDSSGIPATPGEFERARDLRDAARRLAALVTGDDRPAAASAMADAGAAVRTVNAVAAELPAARLKLSDGSLGLAAGNAASPVAAGLARIAVETQRLLAENGGLLRACYAPGCVLYFLKTNSRREWCSVACGNRARAARHYQSVRSARPAR
ncbi:MAG TPA: ABATE domain-containing protein [Trebonia sp.]|jgi:predicted RNA-binding Zn ribbon-like protein